MGGLPTGTVNGFAVDPANPRAMLVAMRDGIFRSDDAGQVGEATVWASVNIPTGMGGSFHYAGTGEGLLRNPDCF